MKNDPFMTLIHSTEQAVDKLVKDYALACEKLTQQQLAELICQIIKSGDIFRLVVNDPSLGYMEVKQSMVYQPFRDVERLRNEIKTLKDALLEITTCQTCMGSGQYTPECYGCLSGIGSCTCKTDPVEKCPQCQGTGREYYDSEKAKQCVTPVLLM